MNYCQHLNSITKEACRNACKNNDDFHCFLHKDYYAKKKYRRNNGICSYSSNDTASKMNCNNRALKKFTICQSCLLLRDQQKTSEAFHIQRTKNLQFAVEKRKIEQEQERARATRVRERDDLKRKREQFNNSSHSHSYSPSLPRYSHYQGSYPQSSYSRTRSRSPQRMEREREKDCSASTSSYSRPPSDQRQSIRNWKPELPTILEDGEINLREIEQQVMKDLQEKRQKSESYPDFIPINHSNNEGEQLQRRYFEQAQQFFNFVNQNKK